MNNQFNCLFSITCYKSIRKSECLKPECRRRKAGNLSWIISRWPSPLATWEAQLILYYALYHSSSISVNIMFFINLHIIIVILCRWYYIQTNKQVVLYWEKHNLLFILLFSFFWCDDAGFCFCENRRYRWNRLKKQRSWWWVEEKWL